MNNLIINPQFIGSQQTHRKRRLHRIELQEDRGAHGSEDQRERRSRLATSYGPVSLWWTTHTSSERQQGWCRSPPWSIPPPAGCRKRPPDGIAEEQRLAAVEKLFRVALYWFPNIREFIEVELGQMEPRGAHKASAPPQCAPCFLVTSSWVFWPPPEDSRVSFVQKKIIKKFHSVWTPFGTDFLKNQKQVENSNWHWALS
jgi:hypothetical protein